MPIEILNKLAEFSTESGIAPERFPLLVDLGHIRMELLPTFRAQLPDLVACLDMFRPAAITLIGSGIPQSLNAVVPEFEHRELPRLQVRLWRELKAAIRYPFGLGDHLVVTPNFVDVPGPFPNINAKLLYASSDYVAVFRGRSRKKESLESQYSRLATSLVNSQYFRGADFSWGDKRLDAMSRGRLRLGDPSSIIAIATSHHLEEMSRQMVRELSGLSE